MASQLQSLLIRKWTLSLIQSNKNGL